MDKNFKKNLIKGVSATSIGQIATLVIYFVTTIILARELNTVNFGEFALILAIAGILQLFSSLGLDSTLIKFISDDTDEKSYFFLKLLSIKVISLIIISIIFIIISKIFVLFDPKINSYTFYIILIFLLSSLRDFFNSQLVGLRKFRSYVYVQVITALFKLIAYISCFLLNLLDLNFLVYVEISTLLFSFILQQILSPIKYSFKLGISAKDLKEIFIFSYPLYFNSVLQYANNSLNNFIIAGYLGTISLAQYSVAEKIPSAITKLYGSFIIVFFPNISLLFNKNKLEDATDLINKTISALNTLIAPLILFTFMFKDQLVVLLFSEKYLSSSFPFFLLVTVIYFRSVSAITGYSIVAKGKTFHSFINNFGSTIVGLSLAFILTPKYGIEGAVYSIFISRLLSALGGILMLRSYSLRIKLIPVFYPIILSLIFIWLYNTLFISNIIIGIGLFILFIIIQFWLFKDFRGLIKEVLSIIKHSFSRIILRRN